MNAENYSSLRKLSAIGHFGGIDALKSKLVTSISLNSKVTSMKYVNITKYFALVIFLQMLSPSALANKYAFSSPTVGFAITKPASWHFVSANTYLDQMKQVKWDDPSAQEHWNKALRAPIVVISKFPPTHNGINPSFKVDAKPYGVIPSGLDGPEILSKLIPMLQQRFKNSKIDIAPMQTTLGNQNAGYAKITYTSTSTTGVDVEISSEIWTVPMKYYVFIIGATDAPSSKSSSSEIQKIVQSISIE